MTEIPRETRVLDAVVSLVDSLLDDFDVVDLLTRAACEISLPASSRQDSQNGCEAMPTTVGSKSSAIT